jgi:hypothetical protein
MSGRRNFNGVLHGVRDGKVSLDRSIPAMWSWSFGNIDKARLVPKFDLTISGWIGGSENMSREILLLVDVLAREKEREQGDRLWCS